MYSKKLIAPVLLLCFISSLELSAAEPPPSTDVAVTQKRITEETRKKLEEEHKKIEIEKEPSKEEPSGPAEQQFFVRQVVLKGNESISIDILEPFVTPYEGRDLTLTKANELARKIESEYRYRGYIATLVFFPPQKVVDGTLTIQIVEGRMGKLYIEGNKWFSDSAIRRYWAIKENEVLRYEDVRRNAKRMGENPDRTVRVVLKAGEKPGYTDVYIKVEDHFPFHATFQFDNQGVRPTGKRRFDFVTRYNNWIIPDSILLAGTVFGKDFGAVFTQYIVPLTAHGTKLVSGFSHSQVAPKKEFKSLDINGIAQTYTVSLHQTLLDRERFLSNGWVGFDFKESTTRSTVGTRRRDRLRVLHSGFDFAYRDKWGITAFENEISFGIKLFGASGESNPLAGRAGAEPDFIKFEPKLTRSFSLPYDTQAIGKLSSQLSPHKLTPQEEFFLGGATTVRGYPEGDFLGDQGILLNFEYLVPFRFLPKTWKVPHSDQPLWKETKFVFFYDLGYARLRGPASTEIQKRFLSGIGAGIRIRLSKYLYGRVEFAHVLGQEPLTDSDHTRVHFSLQVQV